MQQVIRHDSISCGPDLGVDWRFGGEPEWRMTDKEGRSWSDIGPMNDLGRKAVIAHFRLEPLADKLPLEMIRRIEPGLLLRLRDVPADT